MTMMVNLMNPRNGNHTILIVEVKMKCEKCGVTDNGTGDWAHVCGPVKVKESGMNERIREFAIQSGLPTALDYHQKRYEKFAELIVLECAALAKSKSEYIQSIGTDDRGDQIQLHSLAWQFEEFAYAIKKHFGVEE